MNHTDEELLNFVTENDVKFVRMAFCDLLGTQKNVAIMADRLPQAFEKGISFNASAIAGFESALHSDLFLLPESTGVAILPWRPSHERVMRLFCSVKNPDGSDFAGDSRCLLKQAVKKAADMGYFCRVGTECEFYLFHTDENEQPTKIPFDHGSYADIAPLDRCENVRRQICLALEEMGLRPESSHHERGPGQNEVDFCYSDPLTAADNFITFKSVAKSIALQNGLFASFLPKPLINECGNGMHINLSVMKNGKSLFQQEPHHSKHAESFIQGILDRTAEISIFLNPLPNSYARIGTHGAPRYITWSHQNRAQLVRIPAARGGENLRMELRSPDPSCNPYLALALLICAGLEGIENEKKLTEATTCDFSQEYIAEKQIAQLPQDMGEALSLAENSKFIRSVLPAEIVDRYLKIKHTEWEQYQAAEDKEQYDFEHILPLI